MEDDNNNHEKELNELSETIVSALTHSDAVMDIIADLKERGVVDSSTHIGLALKVDDLSDLSDSPLQKTSPAHQDHDRAISHTDSIAPDDATSRNIIDGRDLTENEADFEEWANSGFDEKQWMKELGLTW